MSFQPEENAWIPDIYEWSLGEEAWGGRGGVMNRPLLELASRTKYLKSRLDDLNNTVGGVFPAGAVAHFALNSAPGGWLPADGAAVSRDTYAVLFNAIGTTFGAGDGSSTFNLPDLRGEFIRGLDAGRWVDAGRALGSSQGDLVGTVDLEIYAASGSLDDATVDGLGENGSAIPGEISGTKGYVSTSGSGTRLIQSRGSETRPRNIALLACIKY